MPFAKFSRAFDYTPKAKAIHQIVAYKAGFEGEVPQAHYDAALEAGAIVAPAPAKAPDKTGK